ncbi:hypothetical protein [Yersinia ruckeri]|uniref:hypothetical protein n=1 Tax=Yersinia ruckeri TaxID=29486 RepID=UPI0022389B55|nr:hypothetical protein [Yersinia ruckeri]MCW6598776.1 hypothetical protein [Yersinia ruckeri]
MAQPTQPQTQQATPFENFVNKELPKRLSTDIPESGNLPAGKVLVTTGLGLSVELRDGDDAGAGVNEHALVVNGTDKVIPKGTPLAASVALPGFDLSTGKLYIRPATIADTLVVGIAKTDIGASDLTANIFAEGQALLRGIIEIDYQPVALDQLLPDMDAGKTVTVYSNGEVLSCDSALAIAVGQVVRYEYIPAGGEGTEEDPEDGDGAADPVIRTTIFVTLQGTEYAGSVGSDSIDQGTIVIDGILGTNSVTDPESGAVKDKISYQVVDQVIGADGNLGQPQLLTASLIEQTNPTYLAIRTIATLESGTKLKVINKADNTSIAIKTPPLISLDNGLKHMTIEFEDPTAIFSLAEASAANGLYLQVVHPAGGKSDPIVIKTKNLPKFGDVHFTLPAGQTAVKTNDILKLTVEAPATHKIAKLEVSGEILYDKTNNGNEQAVAIYNAAMDPDKFLESVEIAFKVTTKELSLEAGADLKVTLADGTILLAKTKELGDVQNFNWVQVDNVYPTIEILSTTYPEGQQALKGSEKAVISYKAENIEKVVFTTPDDQVSTDKLEMTFDQPDNQTFSKDVTRIGGEYNVTTKNFMAKAMKVSNGSSATVGQVVNIADKASEVVLTVKKSVTGSDGKVTWEDSVDNRIQSSPADQALWVFFRFDLDADQKLLAAPAIHLNGPGVLKAGSTAKDANHFEYQVRAEDAEARATGVVELTTSANLAGVPCIFKVDDVSKKALNAYALAGFVKRTLKVAAWPNRHVAIGVDVLDPANLQCSNLSKGGSGSLNFQYQQNVKNMENGFTLTDGNDVFNVAGGYWFNCDQANALSNTTGEMLIELEEI